MKGHDVFKPINSWYEEEECMTDLYSKILNSEVVMKLKEAKANAPEWVKHVIVDKDGTIVGHEKEPIKKMGYHQHGGRCEILGNLNANS